MNKINEDAINLHRILRGKIEIHNRVSIDAGFGHEEKGILGLIYTPGAQAVIMLAALINSLKIVDKKMENIKVVITGAGSAGYGIFKILKEAAAGIL